MKTSTMWIIGGVVVLLYLYYNSSNTNPYSTQLQYTGNTALHKRIISRRKLMR